MLNIGLGHRKPFYCLALLFGGMSEGVALVAPPFYGQSLFCLIEQEKHYTDCVFRYLELKADGTACRDRQCVSNGLNIKYLINSFINKIYSL